jgi:ferredoxin
MRVAVDRAACRGHGNCLVHAADYFDLGDDDVAVTLRDVVPDGDAERVTSAVDSCPMAALTIVA